MKHLLLLLVCSLLSLNSAMAEDGNAALYDVTAPADSAFVRVFNGSSKSVSVQLSAKSAAQQLSAYKLGEYLFTAAGAAKLTVDSVVLDLPLEKNQVLTFFYDGSSLKPIQDERYQGAKKAHVTFYNFTAKPLSLKTVNGKHAVVKKVSAFENGTRLINEIKMAFSAYEDKNKLADFDESFLKKGRSYSYVILAEGDSYQTLVQPDLISTIE
ncbi:alginate O-acetyltransferase AlgF [Litoribrevibacter euphylliae]|uniref:Alginate biosynthesis protein AlgF n=1 Tax=Litoribrevibacter euphylliae TaxID=1834034 RepID=A0ABV7HHH1_9GAMM